MNGQENTVDAPPNPKRRIRWFWQATVVAGVGLLMIGIPIAPLLHFVEEDRKATAQLECGSIATAIEAYTECRDNPKHEFPRTLDDLVNPPFGGSPFLRNGERDLFDPWGKKFDMEHATKPNGDKYIIVKTTAPDGTPISQYGLGPGATPRPE